MAGDPAPPELRRGEQAGETARGARAGPRWAGALHAGPGWARGACGARGLRRRGQHTVDNAATRRRTATRRAQLARRSRGTRILPRRCVCAVLCAALFTIRGILPTIYLDTHTPPPAPLSPDAGCTACGCGLVLSSLETTPLFYSQTRPLHLWSLVVHTHEHCAKTKRSIMKHRPRDTRGPVEGCARSERRPAFSPPRALIGHRAHASSLIP